MEDPDFFRTTTMINPVTTQHETAMWLEHLIKAFEREHNWQGDDDVEATLTMILSCKSLLADLVRRLPDEYTEHDPEVEVNNNTLPF